MEKMSIEQKQCKVEGCNNNYRCKGLCSKHYQTFIKYGRADGKKENDKRVRHGQAHSNLYNVWSGMKARCSNKNEQNYDRYGGRGIEVCDRWLDFKQFYLWADGKYKKGLTIDRINNDGNY